MVILRGDDKELPSLPSGGQAMSVVLISGANSGLGQLAALAFARSGHRGGQHRHGGVGERGTRPEAW
jgi:hypothetical protein